jgi:probable rRNA maturation factor
VIDIIDHEFKADLTPIKPLLQAVENDLKIRGNIAIKLGDRPESQYLNTKYRKKEYPTDVLSFFHGDELPDGLHLGDIFICYPIAVDQAKENGVSIENELFRLIIHGILHLLGHDHEDDSGEMLEQQEQILKKYAPS